MPKSALPPHLQDFNWEGTDNDSWLMRLKKKVQVVLAGSHRVPSGFFKFRRYPILLIGYVKGDSRWENADGSYSNRGRGGWFFWYKDVKDWEQTNQTVYLSRIQPWARFHFALQWPLFYNWHWIYHQKNVSEFPTYQSDFGINKMLTSGGGYKRDGDEVYWLTMNVGGNFE